MQRSMIAIGTAALLLCGAVAAQPVTSQSPVKVVTYLFDIFHGKNALVQALLRQAASEPELHNIAQGAAASFDIEALAAQFAEPLSRTLSRHEAEQCLPFIESEGGAALLDVSQTVISADELPRHLNLLPPQQQHAILAFFGSKCFKKTTTFMRSQEAHQISRNYGKSLMCSYAQRTNAEMLGILRTHGECQELSAGSPVATKTQVAQCPGRYSSTIERNTAVENARRILEAKYLHSIWAQSSRSYIVASYLVGVRERIEFFAKNNYPDEIRGKYGSGFAVATIDSDGHVVEVNLLRSTEIEVLDAAFLNMICYPSGYPAFSDELRDKTSALHITFPFSFTNNAFIYGDNP